LDPHEEPSDEERHLVGFQAIKELWIQELTVNFLQKLHELKWG
jgi:hypothetical protein